MLLLIKVILVIILFSNLDVKLCYPKISFFNKFRCCEKQYNIERIIFFKLIFFKKIEDGDVKIVGRNDYGQLGTGDTEDRTNEEILMNDKNIKDIQLSYISSYFLKVIFVVFPYIKFFSFNFQNLK